MVKIVPRTHAPPQTYGNPKILYLGQNADEICDLVSPHIGTIDISYAQEVSAALAASPIATPAQNAADGRYR